ncbi:MAG: GrpB family protein [Candidatus Dormibacteraeota bacterium]|nr:GrpB family protein [Candidatus Dormibacteraeota bacterium]
MFARSDSRRQPSPPSHLDSQLDAVLVGGREPVKVRIADYDPDWPGRFSVERQRVSAALGALALRVEHIGSTAVPELASKPIIDILVEVDRPEDVSLYQGPLESAGYHLRVREPGHLMFRTPERDVHLHLWKVGGAEAGDYLALRDWLRTHREDRSLYERTKLALAERDWPDMNYYAEAKGQVIAEIMARARSRA